MDTVLNTLLSLTLLYGYPIVAGVAFLGYLGIPVTATGILLAAGSFTVTGNFNLPILIVLVTITAIFGDFVGYWIGSHFGLSLLNKFFYQSSDTTNKMEQLNAKLGTSGRWYIFISRWLITPLGVPINLLAGTTAYPFRKFIIFAALGEVVWASGYLYLGHFFGASWSTLLEYAQNLPMLFSIIALAIIAIYWGYRLKNHNNHSD